MREWTGTIDELKSKLDLLVDVIGQIDDEKLSDDDNDKLDKAYYLADECSTVAHAISDNLW